METPDELTAFLATATVDGILGRLLYRGAAWSLMREAGVLPQTAPPLGATIEIDLAEHGFALLRGAMALRAQAGASDLTNKAFERAANAFEALVRNGDPEAPDRGFRRTIAAAAYHLAGFSAVAYSLFNETAEDLNTSPGETAIRHLILRDLDQLRGFVRDWLGDEAHGDEQMGEALGGDEPDIDDILSTILNTTICRALAYFDFALETGEEEPIDAARDLLATAVSLAGNAGNVPLWWISNLCRHLIDDLWQHSLHRNLPTEPPAGAEEKYPDLRRLFIGSLYARKTSEVELWPSQREAARRSTNVSDDLVVALPTSAGKTRVAEIAALMTLSSARRVLIVTPLRALSAQTERSFRKTFAPLGFSVSSLYGASGLSAGDEDALRTREIIIATPEKLDFALRSDASLIDDVGLIVLDEGHMIGPSEREIRYETLVQRLLRRADASDRRIVCLSAILPSGDELDDLTAWIRSDEPGEPVRSDWRPTRQRFGALTWRGKARTLKSGLIQIVAEILERLSREGVLDRDDAWEYLANSREAWRSPDEEAEVAERLAAAVEYDAGGDENDDEDESEDDEEETIDEEPLSQIVERLDATVFGLIEALDADRGDLPKLLDEALKGSLWARQIAREKEDVAPLHKKVFEARADLIWKTTSEQARRGHFAMGVGLEAGLSIDAMADMLAELVDRADGAALSGDVDELADALGGLGERLLFMRPFIPDKKNALPANWKAILRAWISGEEVSKIGPQNMRAVEEAFTYRLVWALEAVRTRRMSLGWSPETVAGGAAAAVETGVPQFMMAMLIRAGLPSRRAAIAAVEDAKPIFVTPAEMRAWLESDEITAYTDAGDWPTPGTAALWARFRTEALSGGIQKWSVERYTRLLDIADAPPAGLYRIVTDEGDGRTWLATPDYQQVAAFRKPAVDPKPSLFSGKLPGNTRLVEALRVGRGKLRWPKADA